MGLHAGFTGTSRKKLTDHQIRMLRILLFTNNYEAIHLGDAINADATCHELITDLNIAGLTNAKRIGHPPIKGDRRAFCVYDEEREPKEFKTRDMDIAHESHELLACPKSFDEEVMYSGTWLTIRIALKMKKKVYIIWPDGKVEDGKEWYINHGKVASVLRSFLKEK